jgi:hypothetical protein
VAERASAALQHHASVPVPGVSPPAPAPTPRYSYYRANSVATHGLARSSAPMRVAGGAPGLGAPAASVPAASLAVAAGARRHGYVPPAPVGHLAGQGGVLGSGLQREASLAGSSGMLPHSW